MATKRPKVAGSSIKRGGEEWGRASLSLSLKKKERKGFLQKRFLWTGLLKIVHTLFTGQFSFFWLPRKIRGKETARKVFLEGAFGEGLPGIVIVFLP